MSLLPNSLIRGCDNRSQQWRFGWMRSSMAALCRISRPLSRLRPASRANSQVNSAICLCDPPR
eukprot:3053446-Rhodomonas_salina.2